MGSYKSFYKSPALLRTFLYLCRKKKISIIGLSNELKIVSTSIADQFTCLKEKGYIEKIGKTKPQYYKINYDSILKDYLTKQKEFLLDILPTIKEFERIEEFKPKYIKDLFKDVRKSKNLKKLMIRWFWHATNEWMEYYLELCNGFDDLFLDLLPKEFATHSKRITEEKEEDKILLKYFHFLRLCEEKERLAGEQAFTDMFEFRFLEGH